MKTHNEGNTTAPEIGRIVYVRRLDEAEIASMVSDDELNSIDNPEELFALWSDEGEPIAVMEGRDAAFAIARANAMTPVSVH